MAEVALKLAPLSERYLRFFGSSTSYGKSSWDNEIHRNQTPGMWAWVLIGGTLACGLMCLGLLFTVFGTYELMQYSFLPLLLLPFVAWASFHVWHYRHTSANALRSAMEQFKNHRFGDVFVRSFIDEYSGDQRSDLMTVYYQVFN